MSAAVRCTAVVVAAGEGRRFGGDQPKQFRPLGGRPLLTWTLEAFRRCDAVEDVVLVVAADQRERVEALLQRWDAREKVCRIVDGGARRSDSVQRGLAALPAQTSLVAVHDGARPLVTPALIARVVAAAAEPGCGAAIPALPVGETVKRARADGMIAETLDRRALRLAQTPQVFEVDLLRRACAATSTTDQVTDDAQLVEAAGGAVRLVQGDPDNIKVTLPEDLVVAEALLSRRLGGGGALRVGQGYDVHRLVPGRPLVLGGVRLEHPLGLLGHSDADVLCHAAGDAMLGAAALGDLGQHFPPDDPTLRGISSLELLRRIAALLGERGHSVENLDATVACQRPRLRPHVPAMRENLARALGVSPAQISVKATTTEGLGFVGREEGIEARAVALVKKTLNPGTGIVVPREVSPEADRCATFRR